MIDLFEHNQIAYDAAMQMMAETGKAAIVHPTGTGKSFIGFKLCEDNPDATICWLSPSEYIFKTQLENVKAAAGGYQPENIKFYTYAKLMQMTPEEIRDIQPDFLVADEFHRIGASEWGSGFKRLIAEYPDVPLLGLSATHIRYLDNQRDMAEELFDGNIASEMTLGEAIVRGILKSPKYVLSVFAYQEDYERLRSRVRRTKNKAVRDEAERYLETLRRALEKADGLDVIFEKHMTDRTGKYIVFCANFEHMREMQEKAPEFFGKIDAAPHIYTAYSSDSATDKAFADFKADRSEHLKLLYCIDMLNEGVHVDDVSGVVLFRPTVSPIVYKQQIGRALSVSGSGTPVIFDIVNNIDNLYAIDSIRQEMREALRVYDAEGREVEDHFKVFDEVRDARELFERLNDTLSASWDTMYGYARQYYLENEDLEVPYRYKTPEGYSLGSWLAVQRKVYAGLQYGVLCEERIAKLNAIGMVWDGLRVLSWKRYYEEATRYFEQNGDLNVPATYVTESGVRLGAWISNQRTAMRSGSISEEHIQKLEAIGMIWSVIDQQWEQNFSACQAYFMEHGDLNIPVSYCSPNGMQIGTWLTRQRDIRKGKVKGSPLTEEQISHLDAIGMVWEGKFEQAWSRGYNEAVLYYREHGNLNVPTLYVAPSGYKLGRWIADRREKGKQNHSPERQRQLDELHMVWEKPDSWEVRYALAADYFKEHGDLNIPADYKADGIWIAKWLNEQRQIYIGNRPGKTLSAEQIERLKVIGMDWGNRNHTRHRAAWVEQYKAARDYYVQHKSLSIPSDYRTESGKKLGVWLMHQRQRRRQGKLPDEQIHMLDAIGMVWEFDDSWEIGFGHAEDYYRQSGDLNIANSYVCEDGYKLGNWISNQRTNYNIAGKQSEGQRKKLSSEQIFRLEAIGMRWNPAKEQWMIGYEHAKLYMRQLAGRAWKSNYVSADGFKTGQWIRGQMRTEQDRGIDSERRRLLEEIGLLTRESKSPAARPVISSDREISALM